MSGKKSIYALFKVVNILCIVVFFFWYITPIIRSTLYGNFFNLIIVAVVLLWIVTALLLNPKWIFKWNVHLVVVALMLLTYIFLSVFEFGGNTRSYLTIAVSFWFPLYVFHYYQWMKWNKAIVLISTMLIGILTVTTITTLIGLSTIPNAARILTSSSSSLEENTTLYNMNIGGYDFIYGMIIFYSVLINFITLNYLNKKVKVFCFILLLLIILMVVNSSFTIAIISLILATLLGLLSKKSSKTIIINLLIIIGVFWVFPQELIGIFLGDINNYITNEYISARIREISLYLQGYNFSGYHLSNRVDVYLMSAHTIFNSPIYGVGPYYYISSVGIGYHSQILDDIARYGIFGFVFFCVFFYTFYKYVSQVWKGNQFTLNFLVPLSVFIFISLINPTFSSQSISLILFFLIPSLPIIYNFITTNTN